MRKPVEVVVIALCLIGFRCSFTDTRSVTLVGGRTVVLVVALDAVIFISDRTILAIRLRAGFTLRSDTFKVFARAVAVFVAKVVAGVELPVVAAHHGGEVGYITIFAVGFGSQLTAFGFAGIGFSFASTGAIAFVVSGRVGAVVAIDTCALGIGSAVGSIGCRGDLALVGSTGITLTYALPGAITFVVLRVVAVVVTALGRGLKGGSRAVRAIMFGGDFTLLRLAFVGSSGAYARAITYIITGREIAVVTWCAAR